MAPPPLTGDRWDAPQACVVTRFWKILLVTVASAITVAFAWLLIGVVFSQRGDNKLSHVFNTALGLGLVTFSAFGVYSWPRYQIILRRDSITLVGAFWSRTFARDEISSKLEQPMAIIPTVTLFTAKFWRFLQIAFIYDKNDEIRAWVNDIAPSGKDTAPAWVIALRERRNSKKRV